MGTHDGNDILSIHRALVRIFSRQMQCFNVAKPSIPFDIVNSQLTFIGLVDCIKISPRDVLLEISWEWPICEYAAVLRLEKIQKIHHVNIHDQKPCKYIVPSNKLDRNRQSRNMWISLYTTETEYRQSNNMQLCKCCVGTEKYTTPIDVKWFFTSKKPFLPVKNLIHC